MRSHSEFLQIQRADISKDFCNLHCQVKKDSGFFSMSDGGGGERVPRCLLKKSFFWYHEEGKEPLKTPVAGGGW